MLLYFFFSIITLINDVETMRKEFEICLKIKQDFVFSNVFLKNNIGTPKPEECSPGSYRNSERGASQADCFPCPAGYYCEGPNSTTFTGPCAPGYYCPDSAYIASPTPAGYECPPGYFCEEGFTQPLGCEPGKRFSFEQNKFVFTLLSISHF